MKRHHVFFTLLIILSLSTAYVYAAQTAPYKNASLPVDERVADLISRMTLEEKIAQLNNYFPAWLAREGKTVEDVLTSKGVGGITLVDSFTGEMSSAAEESAVSANKIQRVIIEKTRLGIPAIIHSEACHGLTAYGATSFPHAIALAATFNENLMGRVSDVIATETRVSGFRQVLSPVVNIARDPRWGRTQETYGEDPYLTSRMGVAFCTGFTRQGIITTPKHFVANFGDGGRDSNAIHFSERLLREVYFPAYKACIQEAGALSVMPAFNTVDGRPCNASHWLLTDILRTDWGFEGYTVCDYDAIVEVMSLHKTASSKEEAAAQAILAGMDRELPAPNVYESPLLDAVSHGLISEWDIDKSVRRILTVKFRLGLFENPYVDPDETRGNYDSPEHRALALQAARECIVLMKNADGTLPLNTALGTIAVIGPDADVAKLGNYSGYGMPTVSILQGIKNHVSGATKVIHEHGTYFVEYKYPAIPPEHFFHRENGSLKPGLKGEYYDSLEPEGEPAFIRIDENIAFDWGGGIAHPDLGADVFSVRWTGVMRAPVTGPCTLSFTSNDGARIRFDDNLLLDNWNDRGNPTDYFRVNLEKGREYDISIEYYENKWNARAILGWDLGFAESEGTKIARAAKAAAEADAAVIMTTIVEGEFWDRGDLNLPGYQEKLISAVAATGTPTIVVLVGGSAITMNKWLADADAIVNAWYPGEEGGNAVAEVLFGKYNPAGRLPITFPRDVSQLPLHYNYKPSGRGFDYVSMSAVPQFPFGYGMSYTTFEYGALSFDRQTIRPDGSVTVSVDVTNTGDREGDEVVQLYLHDEIASVSRPVKELKGFKRLTLKSGETKRVSFTLGPDKLSMFDEGMNHVVEPGTFRVMIGASSSDIRAEGTFDVAGN